MDKLEWFKSSYSSGNGQCVECAYTPDGGMAVRDSKNQGGDVLRFGAEAWLGFLGGIRAGRVA